MQETPKDILTEITPLEQSDCMYLRAGEKELFSYPLHRHEEIEINFIENCAGRLRVVGDNIEELGQTELVLIGCKAALRHRRRQLLGGDTRDLRHHLSRLRLRSQRCQRQPSRTAYR